MSAKSLVRLGGFAAGTCALVLLLTAACGGSEEIPCTNDLTGRRTLRGHYIVGHEAWVFQPCGGDTALWVDPFYAWSQAKGRDLLSEATPAQPPKPDAGTMQPEGPPGISTIYLEIVAEVSPLGVYGHAGRHGQELTVVEILSASATSPSDCLIELMVFTDPHPECKP